MDFTDLPIRSNCSKYLNNPFFLLKGFNDRRKIHLIEEQKKKKPSIFHQLSIMAFSILQHLNSNLKIKVSLVGLNVMHFIGGATHFLMLQHIHQNPSTHRTTHMSRGMTVEQMAGSRTIYTRWINQRTFTIRNTEVRGNTGQTKQNKVQCKTIILLLAPREVTSPLNISRESKDINQSQIFLLEM